jgi:site-specific DNA-methyltransferase (adenine-specific)
VTERIDLRCGDSLDVLATLDAHSFDSCVTDPPYGISFMGSKNKWDYDVPSVELWKAVLRVLKPGAHLLAFSSPRTYHRMVGAIEDAGFEIRDQLMWLFGSGLPKSLNVSKAIDAGGGPEAIRRHAMGAGYTPSGRGRKNYDHGGASVMNGSTEAAELSELAKQWDGLGTALKPAHEPIVLARKPFTGTVAQNVLAHGTGALNIDGCRIPVEAPLSYVASDPSNRRGVVGTAWQARSDATRNTTAQRDSIDRTNRLGRWPANVLHDGSDEVVNMFPAERPGMNGGGKHTPGYQGGMFGAIDSEHTARGDNGSAARFFWSPKASRSEREDGCEPLPPMNGAKNVGREEGSAGLGPRSGAGRTAREVRNTHTTVKPLALMRYLCRLVTPPGGRVLDPFMGSGTTGRAADCEGFRFLGIDREPEYVEIARHRIAGYAPLFAEGGAR